MACPPHARAWGKVMTERRRMHAGLVLVQLGYAGYTILTRAALTSGLSRFVFPVYRNALALLLLAPAAWHLERRRRPPLTPSLLARLFLLGLLGVFLNQALYLAGLQLTSPTITALMQNLVPVFAFLISALFRLEQVQWRRRHGAAKLLGTAACVAGALLVGLYRGPVLLGPPPTRTARQQHLELRVDAWHLGVLSLAGNALSWAAYLNLQVPVLADFPAPISLAALVSLFGTLQLLALALLAVPLGSAWLLRRGSQAASVVYSGAVASGVNLAVQTWCVQRGGPLLVAVYEPLQCAVVAVLALVLLGESLCLGAVLGGLLIVLGLYSVTWGQAEAQRLGNSDGLIRQSLLPPPNLGSDVPV